MTQPQKQEGRRTTHNRPSSLPFGGVLSLVPQEFKDGFLHREERSDPSQSLPWFMAYWHSVLLHSLPNPGKRGISREAQFSQGSSVLWACPYGDVPGNPVLKSLHWACVQSCSGSLRSHITVAKKKKKKHPF